MLDLALAILHHVIVFSLVAVVFAELTTVRRGMDTVAVTRVAALDTWYGVLAGLILVVGFSRAAFAAKGWYYYEHNAYFWAKIGTFAVIGMLSIPPTFSYLRWRRAGTLPTNEMVAYVRRFLLAELVLFVPLLGFAAAMARGYGEF